MDLRTALSIKEKIASLFLKNLQKAGKALLYGAGTSPVATQVTRNVQTAVNGVGIGAKTNGEPYIRILTKNALQLLPSQLSKHFGGSAKDIVIEQTGPIRFKIPTSQHRPPFPGISVAHYRVSAGTLGCFVKDENSRIYILSNNHVLANSNKAKYKDPILQPGKLDGGTKKKDVIAELSYLVDIDYKGPNTMDAAIAEVVQTVKPQYLLNGKDKIAGTTEPVNNMRVEKFGRSTGHTKGRITTRNLDLTVDFGGKEIDFRDQFEVKGYHGKMFCDEGDSGSLIFEKDSLKAVGLLFAGTDDGTTFASPIKAVLEAFSVKLL